MAEITPTPFSKEEYREQYVDFWYPNKYGVSAEYFECEFDYLYDNYSVEYIRNALKKHLECLDTEEKCYLPDGFNESEELCNKLK